MFDETILLVDDNRDDVLLMKRAMQKASLRNPVQVLTDGSQVLDYLEGRDPFPREQYPLPSLILLDLKMPRMAGLEVLEWIRQHPTLRRLCVIVLTSSQEVSDINCAYDLGANSYLVKPTRFDALVEMTKSLKQYWLGWAVRPDCQPR